MCEEPRTAPIYDAIHAFINEWPRAEFGPAHIVLSDFNLIPDGHIRWCLGIIVGERQRRGHLVQCQHPAELDGVNAMGIDFYARVPDDELIATEAFLRDRLLPMVEAAIADGCEF